MIRDYMVRTCMRVLNNNNYLSRHTCFTNDEKMPMVESEYYPQNNDISQGYVMLERDDTNDRFYDPLTGNHLHTMGGGKSEWVDCAYNNEYVLSKYV